MPTPLVAVPTDIKFFDDYTWHATPAQYLDAALYVAGVIPLLVPSFGDELDIDSILDRVDGVLVSGAKSNVHPSLYGEVAQESHEPFDPARDATTLPLIRRTLERGIPLLAICRGIQELNVALGGSLATEIQEMEGRQDHRGHGTKPDEKFAISHRANVKAGSCLADIVGAGTIEVNSVHRQGISRLAPRLQVEAIADDGTVEAVSVIDSSNFALGVQWHPEYWAQTDSTSRRILEAFGAAVRAYAAQK